MHTSTISGNCLKPLKAGCITQTAEQIEPQTRLTGEYPCTWQDSVYHHGEGSVESLGPFHYQTLPRIKLNDDPNFDR